MGYSHAARYTKQQRRGSGDGNPGGGSGSLAFTTEPAGATAGATIPSVVVTARTNAGFTDTSFTGNVTVAIGTNPASGTLSGTLTQSAVAGVATFGDLSLNNAGVGYTLTASATGYTGATSTTFTITAASSEPTYNPAIHTLAWSDDFETYTVGAHPTGYSVDSSHGTVAVANDQAFSGTKSVKITWNNDGCLGGSDANCNIQKSIGTGDTHRDWIVTYNTLFSAGYKFYWDAGGCSRGVSEKEWINFYTSSPPFGGKWGVDAHKFSAPEMAAAQPPIYTASLPAAMLWCLFIDASDGSSKSNIQYPQHLLLPGSAGAKDPYSLVDSAWHRITIRTKKESSIDKGDGVVQMWVDGNAIMNYDGTDSNSPAFNLVYVPSASGMYHPFIYVGIFNGGAPQAQSRWVDKGSAFYVTAS